MSEKRLSASVRIWPPTASRRRYKSTARNCFDLLLCDGYRAGSDDVGQDLTRPDRGKLVDVADDQ
jgi:hypothetical protein